MSDLVGNHIVGFPTRRLICRSTGEHACNVCNASHIIWQELSMACLRFVCLFVLRHNVPVNNFSVMSGRSQRFLGLTSTVGS